MSGHAKTTKEQVLQVAQRLARSQPPSMETIAQRLGLTKGTVHYHVKRLKEEGRWPFQQG